MTCRHHDSINNRECGSYRTPDEQRADLEKQIAAVSQRFGLVSTPDSSNYEIEEAAEVGNHLVLRVKYPNCKACSYEGSKVMVFLNSGTINALKWKTIDPHFREPIRLGEGQTRPTEAPPPSARFPGSDTGWQDAIKYAADKPGGLVLKGGARGQLV